MSWSHLTKTNRPPSSSAGITEEEHLYIYVRGGSEAHPLERVNPGHPKPTTEIRRKCVPLLQWLNGYMKFLNSILTHHAYPSPSSSGIPHGQHHRIRNAVYGYGDRRGLGGNRCSYDVGARLSLRNKCPKVNADNSRRPRQQTAGRFQQPRARHGF